MKKKPTQKEVKNYLDLLKILKIKIKGKSEVKNVQLKIKL
jgi:hypothetical protein